VVEKNRMSTGLCCPICPYTLLHSFEETGVHLSIVHHLSFSAHILANFLWLDSNSHKQAELILKDVAIMNQVLWNMKANVDDLENKVKLRESGMLLSPKLEVDTKTEIFTEPKEEKRNEKSGDFKESFKGNEFIEDHLETPNYLIKAEPIDNEMEEGEIGIDTHTQVQNRLQTDELDFLKNLYVEKEKECTKLNMRIIDQHVQIKSLEKKIKSLEENAVQINSAVRKVGHSITRAVKDQFKNLEDNLAHKFSNAPSISQDQSSREALSPKSVKKSDKGEKVGVKRIAGSTNVNSSERRES